MTDAREFLAERCATAVSVDAIRSWRTTHRGAGSPITEAVLPSYPDLGQNSFYEYGAREGVPRILDLLDRHSIKMTSFMIGDAVRRHPDVAAEIVRRGHEAGAHGAAGGASTNCPGRRKPNGSPTASQRSKTTGTRPTGYNNYWIRPGVNTLEILQDLGFATTSTISAPTSRFSKPSTDNHSPPCPTPCTSTTLPASTSRLLPG